MYLLKPLPVVIEEYKPRNKAEVVPLIDPSLERALENLNRITGLQFESYPQSLVNSDSGKAK